MTMTREQRAWLVDSIVMVLPFLGFGIYAAVIGDWQMMAVILSVPFATFVILWAIGRAVDWIDDGR